MVNVLMSHAIVKLKVIVTLQMKMEKMLDVAHTLILVSHLVTVNYKVKM